MLIFSKKWLGNRKVINKTFFIFGSTCRILNSAEYSSENVFGRSLVAGLTVVCNRAEKSQISVFASNARQ
jgi:hypothetical protein